MTQRRLLFDNQQQSDEINISPLIDIVFILLIFFIVTTVFVEETGVQVSRPQAATAISLEKNSVLIAITNEGNVVYAGQEIGVKGVRSIVKRLLKKEEVPVIIQADKKVSIDLYTKVHDEAALAGAHKISMATKH